MATEIFLPSIRQIFPHMKEKYIRTFGNRYEIISPNNRKLMELFHKKCSEHGIVHSNKKIFEYLSTFDEKNSTSQLSLFRK